MTESSGSGHAGRVSRALASAVALLVVCGMLGAGSALAAVGGEYTISGLPTGDYKLHFEAGGERGGNYLSQYYLGKATLAEATPVSVTAPSQVSGANASLSAGGQISGKVTSAPSLGGKPLAGIFVCATKTGEFLEECAETNGAGEYTIVALQSGKYKVSFFGEFSGYFTEYYKDTLNEEEATPVEVTAGTTTAAINAVMQSPASEPRGTIAGTVVEAGGVEPPLAGVEVCAFEFETFTERCTTTSASGEYAIAGLPSGEEYEVEFSDRQNGFQPFVKELVKVEVGKTTKVNAKLKKGATISGTVRTATGLEPLAGVFVVARGPETGVAVTNEAGQYHIGGLPGGEYTVEFIPEFGSIYEAQYYKETANVGEAQKVKVTVPETVTEIDGKLPVAGQVTGTVTAAVGGAPIANVLACANFSSCALTNSEGKYDIVGLSAASYKVSFTPTREGQNFLRQTREGEVVVAKGATVSGINAALQPGGQISGVVFSAATEATLGNIRVCAIIIPANETVSCALTSGGKEKENPQEPPKEAPKEQVKEAPKPEPNSAFGQAKAPSFNAKTATITFSFTVAQAGTFHWSLFFKNADVGFADALGVGPSALFGGGAPAAAVAAHKCAKGQTRHKGKCVRLLIPFANGSRSVAAGTVQIKVKAGSKAAKALKAGRTLHVSGTFTFQSALGGKPVAHTVSTVVRAPKKHKNH